MQGVTDDRYARENGVSPPIQEVAIEAELRSREPVFLLRCNSKQSLVLRLWNRAVIRCILRDPLTDEEFECARRATAFTPMACTDCLGGYDINEVAFLDCSVDLSNVPRAQPAPEHSRRKYKRRVPG